MRLHFIQGHIFIYTWKEPIKLMSWKQLHVIVHHKSLCILARILKTFLLCSFQCQHNGYCLPSHSSDMGCTFRTDKGTMLKSYTYNLKMSTPLRTFALYNSRELLFSPSPKFSLPCAFWKTKTEHAEQHVLNVHCKSSLKSKQKTWFNKNMHHLTWKKSQV